MTNNETILKNAFWLSKKGKIFCIAEYIFLFGLNLFIAGYCLHYVLTSNPQIEPDASLGKLASLGILIPLMLAMAMITHWKAYVWPCLFIWRFFKINAEDIATATENEKANIQARISAYKKYSDKVEAGAIKEKKRVTLTILYLESQYQALS